MRRQRSIISFARVLHLWFPMYCKIYRTYSFEFKLLIYFLHNKAEIFWEVIFQCQIVNISNLLHFCYKSTQGLRLLQSWLFSMFFILKDCKNLTPTSNMIWPYCVSIKNLKYRSGIIARNVISKSICVQINYITFNGLLITFFTTM